MTCWPVNKSRKRKGRRRKKWYVGQKKTIKTSEVIFYVRYNKKDSEDCNQVVVECGAFWILNELSE